jgi:hypothetical protein
VRVQFFPGTNRLADGRLPASAAWDRASVRAGAVALRTDFCDADMKRVSVGAARREAQVSATAVPIVDRKKSPAALFRTVASVPPAKGVTFAGCAAVPVQ